MTFQAGCIDTLSKRVHVRERKRKKEKGEGVSLNDNVPYAKAGDSVEG